VAPTDNESVDGVIVTTATVCELPPFGLPLEVELSVVVDEQPTRNVIRMTTLARYIIEHLVASCLPCEKRGTKASPQVQAQSDVEGQTRRFRRRHCRSHGAPVVADRGANRTSTAPDWREPRMAEPITDGLIARRPGLRLHLH